MKISTQSAQEWAAATRSGDYDRFLAIQCAPRGARAALYALTAFYLELARIVATVSEPLIGHIRLAWWREALEELAASKSGTLMNPLWQMKRVGMKWHNRSVAELREDWGVASWQADSPPEWVHQGTRPRNHPLLLALAATHHTHPAVLPHLLTMIGARSGELEPAKTLMESAWIAHMDATDGALNHAWATLLDMKSGEAQAPAISAHARAFAMLAQLRAIPLHAALHLPQALLVAHGVDSPAPSPALNGLVEEVITRALALLAERPLTAPVKPVAALSTLTQLHIKRLRAVGYDPYRLRPAKLAAVWQVIWR